MVHLIFIVNGEDVDVDASLLLALSEARDRALVDTMNLGRPFDEWTVYDQAGRRLPETELVGNLPLVDGDRLFLTLRVGAGG